MSFPTVNGMLIETEDETSNKPTANDKGFFSGLAKATIFRNDDALWLSFVVTARIRDHNEGFGAGGVGVGLPYARRDPKDLKGGVGRSAVKLCWNPRWRDLPTGNIRDVKGVRPQTANEFATGFSTRKLCMRNETSPSSSSRMSREGVVRDYKQTLECVGVNKQRKAEVSANTSVPRDTQHHSPFTLLGGGFRQSQGSIPSYWLNSHDQIPLTLVSGAVCGHCFRRG